MIFAPTATPTVILVPTRSRLSALAPTTTYARSRTETSISYTSEKSLTRYEVDRMQRRVNDRLKFACSQSRSSISAAGIEPATFSLGN